MLKTKITKAEFDALDAALKAFYKLEGSDYLLQSDDAAELRAAKQREADARKIAEDEVARLKKIADDAETARVQAETAAAEEKARKAGDTATLEKSWETKMNNAVKAATDRADKLEAQLRTVLVEKEANALAADISVSPSLLAPVIAARLEADLTGDKPVTRVKDANGQPSALNLADLRAELIANTEYSAIIKGTGANGGGAGGFKPGGGAAKKISDMTETERVSFARTDSAAFRAQATAEGYALPS